MLSGSVFRDGLFPKTRMAKFFNEPMHDGTDLRLFSRRRSVLSAVIEQMLSGRCVRLLPHALRYVTFVKFPMHSGSLSILLPEISKDLSDFKLQTESGRRVRLLFWRSKCIILVAFPMHSGTVWMLQLKHVKRTIDVLQRVSGMYVRGLLCRYS